MFLLIFSLYSSLSLSPVYRIGFWEGWTSQRKNRCYLKLYLSNFIFRNNRNNLPDTMNKPIVNFYSFQVVLRKKLVNRMLSRNLFCHYSVTGFALFLPFSTPSPLCPWSLYQSGLQNSPSTHETGHILFGSRVDVDISKCLKEIMFPVQWYISWPISSLIIYYPMF